jgi:tetratricopeptide (TPR) repeat protein
MVPAGAAALALLIAAEAGPKDALEALVKGAGAALRGEHATALTELERAATIAPEVPGVQEALGAAALLAGDALRARRVLARTPEMAVYLAMAEAEGPGGLARAQSVLSAQAKEADASAGVLFLAALAFWNAGQPERAHELLGRSVKRARSALDEAFAPDPAVALSRSVLHAFERLGAPPGAEVELAAALIEAKRRGEAVRIAEGCLTKKETRAAGLRILVQVENAIEARRALERVERVLREEPAAEDARVARLVLLVRAQQVERAKKELLETPPIEDPELAAELDQLKAELTLDRDPAAALEAAEAAVRARPRSDEAVAMMVRALVANHKLDRAEAFANALLKRKPTTVDPFELLGRVAEARGQKKLAAEMALRSRAYGSDRAKLEAAVREREEVLRAVRDGESGVGVTGFEALRAEHPALALPIDIGLARGGTPGFALAARERIFAACAPRLRTLLEHRKSWDAVPLNQSPYGQVEEVEAPLSAADPGRCGRRR